MALGQSYMMSPTVRVHWDAQHWHLRGLAPLDWSPEEYASDILTRYALPRTIIIICDMMNRVTEVRRLKKVTESLKTLLTSPSPVMRARSKPSLYSLLSLYNYHE